MSSSLIDWWDAPMLIIKERKSSEIIIASPHHVELGIPHLPCPKHEDSDENAGFICDKTGQFLGVTSIIMCNASADPNKFKDTMYYKTIEQRNPKYLIEIHGHGGNKTNYHPEKGTLVLKQLADLLPL